MPEVLSFSSFGPRDAFGIERGALVFDPVASAAADMAAWYALHQRGGAFPQALAPATAERTLRSLEQIRLDGIREQQSHYGRPIPELWGKYRMGGNVIWCSTDFYLLDTAANAPVAPQPDPGTPAVAGQLYVTDVAILVCKGPVKRIAAIWADDHLIYQPGNAPVSAVYWYESIAIYHGTETQNPDPTMVDALGSGNVPAYRGSCYVVITGFVLPDNATALPTFTFLVHHDAGGSAPIEQVLTDVATEVGLDSGDYDFSGATGFT